jgi:hypothetical protein
LSESPVLRGFERFGQKNIVLGRIGMTSDCNGACRWRQALIVPLSNKLQKTVKVLFIVMGFAVSRRQTAETCNTGGVFNRTVPG